MSLKEKAITGVFWSFTGRIFTLTFEFVVGIILTRMLSPGEFGLIGMVTIFLILSETLMNSGFSQALIRMPVCAEKDFETAFTFNIGISLFLIIILYISAPYVAGFYQNTQLTSIVQVLGAGLIFNAFSFVQRTRLTRELDFKSLNKISIFSTIGSGSVALFFAFQGYGVWSLVIKTLSRDFLQTLLLMLKSRWIPKIKFYKKSFTALFRFGSKMMVSGLLGIVTNNIVYVLLGKYFHVSDVGYYNRAELFKNLPSQNVESIISTVAYPMLAKLQDDKEAFKDFFRKVFLMTFYIISILMCGLFAVSDTLILIALGEDWTTSAQYLMYLCPLGLLYPLWTLNLNIFNIYGKADIYLRLQTIMQILTVVSVFSGIFFSVKIMIFFLTISSLLSYGIFGYNSGKLTGYTLLNQIREILPVFFISLIMGIIVYLIDAGTNFTKPVLLIVQLVSGTGIILILSEIFKPDPYRFLKQLALSRLAKNTMV